MKAVQVLIIKPDNSVIETTLKDLADYQAAVGGYLEPIPLRDGVMYVDEEYALKPMEFADYNLIATAIVRTIGFGTIMSGGGIYGNAVIVGKTDPEGWDTSVHPEVKTLALEIQAELNES